jgi:hypothetical protein
MVRHRAFHAAIAIAVLCGLVSSAECQSSRAAVQGDVYLVMKSGDVKPVAGSTVYLLPDSAYRRIVHEVCRNAPMLIARRLLDSLPARRTRADSTADSAAVLAEKWVEASANLLANAFVSSGKSTPTGMRAHYVYPEHMPGNYWLWASTQLSSTSYFWLSPVQLVGGKNVTLDLGNTIVREGALDCRRLH